MSERTTAAPRVLVRAAERGPAASSRHPYDPASEIHGWRLSRAAGLGRIAVNLAWIPPGKESAAYHLHHREEEWVLVLSGRGTAEVDDQAIEVGPGDFLGFPPGVAHLVRNTGAVDLLLLEGGEVIPDVEVADFPRLRRRLVRMGDRVAVYPMEAEIPFAADAAPPARAEPAPDARRKEPPRVLVPAAGRGEVRVFHHPQNPGAEIHLSALSRPAGLRRLAVVHARVPAGRDSYVFHVHQHDEEWMFVLSGRGLAEVGDAVHEIGPGDFLGFPAGGPAHATRALPGEDLITVQGGDAWSRTTLDIVDYPRLGMRRTFVGTRSAMTFPMAAAVERE